MLSINQLAKYLKLATKDFLVIIIEELLELGRNLRLNFKDIIKIFKTAFSNIKESITVSRELIKEELKEMNGHVADSIKDIVDKIDE
jgi:hypothetical protein